MKKSMVGLTIAAGLAAAAFGAGLPEGLRPPEESAEQKDARLAWWREARFGMFIHWGVYSAIAGVWNGKPAGGIGEWIMLRQKIPCAAYAKHSAAFNPVHYDPEKWVELAEKSGMKYIVITSKHHDGFALFDSRATDWDVVDATPWKKDLIRPLVDAAHKRGMRIGFYYSQFQDWHHPGGGARGKKWDKAQEGDFEAYIRDIAVPQIRELLTNYGKIDIFWWDTPGPMRPETAAALHKLVHDLQPGIITNNRLGNGFPGDSATPEQHIPATGMGRDFEVCMTLNNTWGYKKHDNKWKSAETVVKNLCDIASKGGNYLLNMGPRADGTIPRPTLDVFGEVGAWLKVNGEAVYATTANPFRMQFPWGRCTKRFLPDGARLYLHVFNWPEGGKLFLPGLRSKIADAKSLLDGSAGIVSRSGEGVTVAFPSRRPGNRKLPEVISVKTLGTLDIAPPALPVDPSEKPAALSVGDADLTGGIRLESAGGKANIGFWKSSGDTVSWTLRAARAGRYRLAADAAALKGAAFEILVDGAVKARVSVPATGDYTRYETVGLGEVGLPAGKAVRLTFRPVAAGWSPVNLRDVIVKKAE